MINIIVSIIYSTAVTVLMMKFNVAEFALERKEVCKLL